MQYRAGRESARASETTAERARVASEAEAKQLETRAAQGVAVGSYNSDRIAKRAQQIVASQRAAAAAGGGDTTDATVQAITDETIRDASMEQLLTMGEAEDRARQDRFAAKVARTTGVQQARSYMQEAKAQRLGATATVLSGVGDMAWRSTYGG